MEEKERESNREQERERGPQLKNKTNIAVIKKRATKCN